MIKKEESPKEEDVKEMYKLFKGHLLAEMHEMLKALEPTFLTLESPKEMVNAMSLSSYEAVTNFFDRSRDIVNRASGVTEQENE